MALHDALLYFATAKAVTATGNADNPIDLKAVKTQFNGGRPLVVMIQINTAADFTTTDETYQFTLQTDDNASFSSAATVATRTIAASILTANSLHVIDIPENTNNERYLGLRHVLGGTTPSVTYTAWIAEKGQLTNMLKVDNAYEV